MVLSPGSGRPAFVNAVFVVFLQKDNDFFVVVEEFGSFFGGLVGGFFVVHGRVEEFEVHEEGEVVVELGEAEVCAVHDLGFEDAFFGDVEYFGHYVEAVSAFAGVVAPVHPVFVVFP